MERGVLFLAVIAALVNLPIDARICTQCNCQIDPTNAIDTCSISSFPSTCIQADVQNQYCTLTITYNGNVESRVFGSVVTGSFQDSHFIQATETIARSGTTWLLTAINEIQYGCDWDGCNVLSLPSILPQSFQMSIDQTILNAQLTDGQLPAQSCLSCANCINDFGGFACKESTCTNGLCYIDEIHIFSPTPANNCTYNFISSCIANPDENQTPRIRIRATYYFDLASDKKLEIDEVDIYCTKDNCNSITLVENLKSQIQTGFAFDPSFQRNATSAASSTYTSTLGGSASSTSGGSASSTSGGSASSTPGGSASSTSGGSASSTSGGSTSSTPGGSTSSTPGGSASSTPGGSPSTGPSGTVFPTTSVPSGTATASTARLGFIAMIYLTTILLLI